MIIVVAPGQGSQTPGFLAQWLEVPGARELVGQFGAEAGVDLLLHGTESDGDTIRDTSIAQPLIVAAGLITLHALNTDGRDAAIGGIAGHSVGEITAAAGAGILTYVEAIRLVAERGRAMAEAAAEVETGMSAVVGGEEDAVLAALDAHGLAPANYNGGGQLVVAGPVEGLAALAAAPPSGSRVIPLQVAGAFHTKYMEPAIARMRAVAQTLEPQDPLTTIWTNRDGSKVDSGAEFLDLLVGQVSSPVRWDRTMESFAAAGVTGIIELAPAGALTGLAKRGLRGVPTVAVKTPADLEAARALLDGDA